MLCALRSSKASLVVTGHQPTHLPYLGNIAKFVAADVLVLCDNMQYSRRGWHNRNRIKDGYQNRAIMLTVPVYTSGRGRQTIKEIKIDNSIKWQKKHWNSIEYYYHKAPYFGLYSDRLQSLYAKEWHKLFDLNRALINLILGELKPELKILIASELGISGRKNDYIIDLCRKTYIFNFLSGQGARAYIDEEYLAAHGINHQFHHFVHPLYPQLGEIFIPGLSAIDLLMNCGPGSKHIIAAINKQEASKI